MIGIYVRVKCILYIFSFQIFAKVRNTWSLEIVKVPLITVRIGGDIVGCRRMRGEKKEVSIIKKIYIYIYTLSAYI